MLGLFPGPWKEHVRAWCLNFLCSGQWASACGRQDGMGGGGLGPQPPAQVPPEPFLRTPQPPALWSLSLPSCPWKLFLSAPGLFSGWGRGGRWTTPVLQMCQPVKGRPQCRGGRFQTPLILQRLVASGPEGPLFTNPGGEVGSCLLGVESFGLQVTGKSLWWRLIFDFLTVERAI